MPAAALIQQIIHHCWDPKTGSIRICFGIRSSLSAEYEQTTLSFPVR